MKRVTGIGGIFFKCKDPAKMNAWYKKHLGFDTTEYGTSFLWQAPVGEKAMGMTHWCPFNEATTYFEPSAKEFMINYCVENLESLVVLLKEEGVVICDELETSEFGKFIHILDIEGNKLELWEPV